MSDINFSDLRSKLLSQIDSSDLPYDQKEALKEEVKLKSDDELLDFIKEHSANPEGEGNGCIFCSIASGKVPSFMIASNDVAVAVLELNPASEGHTIIIPKVHVSKDSIPQEVSDFSALIAEALRLKLPSQPRNIGVSSDEVMGHGIMNIIPVYPDQELSRKPADKSQLKVLQGKLLLMSDDFKPNIHSQTPAPTNIPLPVPTPVVSDSKSSGKPVKKKRDNSWRKNKAPSRIP